MKVTIFGCGYVGLVTGACFADKGFEVVVMDVDEDRIAGLCSGTVPFYEPGLQRLVRNNTNAGRLRFTTSARDAVAHGEFLFIAVGTPSGEDGRANLDQVFAVATTIGELMDDDRLVVCKSTVPVGTGDRIEAIIQEALETRGCTAQVQVASNPEFLKEGAAIDDCLVPDRVVIGTDDGDVEERLRALNAPFVSASDAIIVTDRRSAELTKYAANAMLATKISFINEIANIADRVGADVEQVRRGIAADRRIGHHFIYPGVGFGGSCFPKDVLALRCAAEDAGYQPDLLRAVESVNDHQKSLLFEKIAGSFGNRLNDRVIAVWGLSFKPGTNDMRESPSIRLLEQLWAAGATVHAHDPKALDEARRLFGERPDLQLFDDPVAAAEGADAIAVVTHWKCYFDLDLQSVGRRMRQAMLFDGRNIYEPERATEAGFRYAAVGRPSLQPAVQQLTV